MNKQLVLKPYFASHCTKITITGHFPWLWVISQMTDCALSTFVCLQLNKNIDQNKAHGQHKVFVTIFYSKFGYNSLASQCLLFTLVLSASSICNYMISLAKLLTDKDASQWLVQNVGIDVNIQPGKFSYEKALNFNLIFNIFRNIAFLAWFIPTWRHIGWFFRDN